MTLSADDSTDGLEIDTGVKQLTNQQAVDAVVLVAQRWMQERGLEAYRVMQEVGNRIQSEKLTIPDWAGGKPSATPEAAQVCRAALTLLIASKDESGAWAKMAILDVAKPREQVIDPLTLAIGGTVLIGLVLVSRVEEVDINNGRMKFYKGVPDGLGKLLKSATGFFNQ